MIDVTNKFRQEIKDWLEQANHDFDTGFDLFIRFGHSRALAIQIKRKKIMGKLEYELEKIYQNTVILDRPVMQAIAEQSIPKQIQKVKAVIEEKGTKIVSAYDKIDFDSLTEKQKELYKINRDKHKEMRSWHEKMKLAKTDVDRAICRETVMLLDDEIHSNWLRFDELKNERPGMEETEVNPGGELNNAIDVVKAVSNARSYLSKNISKLEGFSGKNSDLKKLKDKILERYFTIIDNAQVVDIDTIEKLKKHGVIVA